MNDPQPTPEQPANITEAQIVAFLRAKCAEHADIKGLYLRVDTDRSLQDFLVAAKIEGQTEIGFGPTIEVAIANLRRTLKSPDERAAKLREQARQLLQQADGIEAEKEVAS